MALNVGDRVKVTGETTGGELVYVGASRALVVLDDGRTIAPLTASVSPAPKPSPFELGVNVPPDWPDALKKAIRVIGARVARISTERGTLAQLLQAAKDAVALGARPQVLVYDWRTRTPAQLVGLAKQLVPLGLTHLEIGNEDSYGYAGKTPTSQIPTVSAQYARTIKAYAAALNAAGLNVGLLAQADDALRGAAWNDGMFAAVPDLHLHVAGWTVHPDTAGREVERLQRATDQTAAHGAPRDMPIFATEWGIASTATGVTLVADLGRRVNGVPVLEPDNYGHSPNLTHHQAAALEPKVIATMRTVPQLRQVIVYNSHDGAPASNKREDNFGRLTVDSRWNLVEKPTELKALA